MTSKLLIIADSSHPLVRRNRCFDPIHEYTGIGHAILVRLAREARPRGIDLVTADVYLAMSNRPHPAACLTDMVTPFTNKLLAKGVQPAVCMSLESPLVAKNFYHNIVRYAGRFRHNYQFQGTQQRLSASNTQFHATVFPMETRTPLPLQAWDQRNFLVLINSNKRAVSQGWGNPKEIARAIASRIQFLILRAIDPWMRIRELYIDRIQAIEHFSAQADFRLYGRGWEQPISGFDLRYTRSAQQAFAGQVDDKRETMSGFKFAICFENCVFPGYVTEKIFDCFLAGCIPIYFGAPDIADWVPPQTFIDFRQFGNYSDLERFLRGISEAEASHYINAARDFLASPAFDRFTVDYFVNDILSVIEQEFK